MGAGKTDGYGILARGEGAAIAYRARAGRPGAPALVFLGGFRSDMTGAKACALDALAARHGWGFVRFDYQGHGASGGAFEEGTIGTWLADALAVIDELTAGPQILIGSSMGGWIAALVALARRNRVAGLVCIAPALDFTEKLLWPRLGPETRAELRAAGRIVIPSAYDQAGYPITRALIEEGRRHCLLDAPIRLGLPVRILHGMADRDVPWRHGLAFAEALTGSDVRLTLVKDGEHSLSRPEDLDLLQRVVEDLAAQLARNESMASR